MLFCLSRELSFTVLHPLISPCQAQAYVELPLYLPYLLCAHCLIIDCIKSLLMQEEEYQNPCGPIEEQLQR